MREFKPRLYRHEEGTGGRSAIAPEKRSSARMTVRFRYPLPSLQVMGKLASLLGRNPSVLAACRFDSCHLHQMWATRKTGKSARLRIEILGVRLPGRLPKF